MKKKSNKQVHIAEMTPTKVEEETPIITKSKYRGNNSSSISEDLSEDESKFII
jgi:hypothetical protein